MSEFDQYSMEASLFLRKVEGDLDVYTNVNPLWHPPGARGIYGGTIIAQSLCAAQHTVPSGFDAHSMHCSFILAGNSETPVKYHVRRLRDGKSFSTRIIEVIQNGKCILITIISFVKDTPIQNDKVNHALPITSNFPPPTDADILFSDEKQPFEIFRYPITQTGPPEAKKACRWVRAKGKIDNYSSYVLSGQESKLPIASRHAHLSALACMSDFHFIGVVSRAHHLKRFGGKPNITRTLNSFKGSPEEYERLKVYLSKLVQQESDENQNHQSNQILGMTVSMDHVIYFHNPNLVNANEWIFSEMDSPWADHERGLVTQRMWSKDGILIATCFQEGIVRLHQSENQSQSKI